MDKDQVSSAVHAMITTSAKHSQQAGEIVMTNLVQMAGTILEIITLQNVLDLVHKILYTILPDQFVFRFKVGSLLDIGLGGWATV